LQDSRGSLAAVVIVVEVHDRALRPVVRGDGAGVDRLTRRADGVYDLRLSCELPFPVWPWR